jgi:hypothetical protein
MKSASGVSERLSLLRCRELLGPDCRLSDEDLQAIRDRLYDLAELILETAGSRSRREDLRRPA